jgi:hypothetical protein
MKDLVANGIVDTYAPLSDIKGSHVAQFEHVGSGSFMPSHHNFKLIPPSRRSCCAAQARKSSAVVMTISRRVQQEWWEVPCAWTFVESRRCKQVHNSNSSQTHATHYYYLRPCFFSVKHTLSLQNGGINSGIILAIADATYHETS